MAYFGTVEAEAFLAICLERMERISVPQMRKLSERLVKDGVSIDISGNGVYSAAHYYKDFIQEVETDKSYSIRRKSKAVWWMQFKKDSSVFPGIMIGKLPSDVVEIIRKARDELFFS